MQANYVETFIDRRGNTIKGETKAIELPFGRVSARAIVLRRRDGWILGTLHRASGKYALPGGAVDDGETPTEALVRELAEENITLLNSDEHWPERLSVDYYGGYRELMLWFLLVVDEAEIQPCDENIETQWVSQAADVWYPFVREKILLAIHTQMPEYAKLRVFLE
jgi:8-oxo-dGTP pyrophosphatase MutT (NUDIX family)